MWELFCYLQVLLVSTSRNRDLWIVPGGGIEPTEDPRVAAIREVQEEAGAKGSLGRCLGVFEVPVSATFLLLVFIALNAFYRARGIAIACRLLSVCDVGGSGSERSEILETNCTDTA